MSANSRRVWVALRAGRFSLKLDRRVPLVALILLSLTALILVMSISYGEYNISPLEVVQTLTGLLPADHPDAENFHLVVFTFRLPRILTAFLVGVALATSGAILQGITRNPLADPGILGITAGAGLAAVTLIVWVEDAPFRLLPWATFGGAVLAAFVIYLLAWKAGSTAPTRMILIGVAVAAVLTSVINFMLVFGEINDVQQAYLWLTGSVYGRNWSHVRTLALWLVVLWPLALLSARHLNALNLGEDVARGLGTAVEGQTRLLLLISVALAAIAVSVSGTIGFVGLVAPHMARRLVGPAHEGLLPTAALLGGALLVLADLIGRWIIAPSELPIGLVAALIGAPYFMFLLLRERRS